VLVTTGHGLPHGLTGFDHALARRTNLTDSGVQVVAVFVDTEVHELSIQAAKPIMDRHAWCPAAPSNTASDDAVFSGSREFGLTSVVFAHSGKDTPSSGHQTVSKFMTNEPPWSSIVVAMASSRQCRRFGSRVTPN